MEIKHIVFLIAAIEIVLFISQLYYSICGVRYGIKIIKLMPKNLQDDYLKNGGSWLSFYKLKKFMNEKSLQPDQLLAGYVKKSQCFWISSLIIAAIFGVYAYLVKII